MSDENPSIHEANKVVRVLSGEKLKYTVRVHKPDGSVIEWQTDNYCTLDFNNEARCLFLKGGTYGSPPIMKWEEGMIMLTEENPK